MNDDELLVRLDEAFAVDLLPSAASIDALRHAVIAIGEVPTPRRWRRRLGISALAGGFVMGGGGTAFALSGSPLPEPVRRVVYDIGLPVDSPALASARSELASLREAVAKRERGSVATEEAELRARFERLNHNDQGEIRGDVAQLTAEADQVAGPQQQIGDQQAAGTASNGNGTGPASSLGPVRRDPQGSNTGEQPSSNPGASGANSGSVSGQHNAGQQSSVPDASGANSGSVSGQHNAGQQQGGSAGQ